LGLSGRYFGPLEVPIHLWVLFGLLSASSLGQVSLKQPRGQTLPSSRATGGAQATGWCFVRGADLLGSLSSLASARSEVGGVHISFYFSTPR
jgi:hypothetical protein